MSVLLLLLSLPVHILQSLKYHCDQLSEKPGNVRSFDSHQGSIRDRNHTEQHDGLLEKQISIILWLSMPFKTTYSGSVLKRSAVIYDRQTPVYRPLFQDNLGKPAPEKLNLDGF